MDFDKIFDVIWFLYLTLNISFLPKEKTWEKFAHAFLLMLWGFSLLGIHLLGFSHNK